MMFLRGGCFFMMLHYNQEDFYKLPDWKKIKLKRSKSKYRGYRIMTRDQENHRRDVILSICAHFGMVTVEELDEEVFAVMENYWPTKIEYFLTPKMLDYLNVDSICEFGYCSHCIHYTGYTNHKIRTNVIPYTGVCTKDSKAITPYNSRCCNWELGTFHIQIMFVRIEKLLENCNSYNMDEYTKDLENFNFWNYFFSIK
jgi:hypothetical protein